MRKIVNISLVLLLLFSTTGVAVSKHFCGEILQSIAVNDVSNSCCDSQDMPDDCCSDELSLEKTDEVQLSQFNLKFSSAPYLLLYFTTSLYHVSLEPLEKRIPEAFVNLPPLVDQEIFILDQSFLL